MLIAYSVDFDVVFAITGIHIASLDCLAGPYNYMWKSIEGKECVDFSSPMSVWLKYYKFMKIIKVKCNVRGNSQLRLQQNVNIVLIK